MRFQPLLRRKGLAKKERMFSYEAADEPIDSAESRFRIDFFTRMVDTIIKDTDMRFTALT